MKLGKSVYTAEGKILLNAGVSLSQYYIKNLIKKNIPAVYIDDELSKDIDIDDVIDYEVKVQAISNIKNIFEKASESVFSGRSDTIGFVSYEHYKDVRNIIFSIMGNVKKNKNSLFNIIEVMSTDLSVYTHSVNVAILSVLTGMSMKLNDQQLTDLGIGAMMHDIGKVRISDALLNKSDPLTPAEFDEIKKHSSEGYFMVKDNSTISSIVKNIILFHHERLDGSGYPLGIGEDRINKYIRIVSMADIFDAMVTKKAYRKSIPGYKAIEHLQSKLGTELDKDVFSHFIKNVALYPKGTGVVLNTGEKGIVIDVEENNPTRPTVRVIYAASGDLYPGFKVVNLMKELTLFVEDTCYIIY